MRGSLLGTLLTLQSEIKRNLKSANYLSSDGRFHEASILI